jgi:predicted GTPase
VASNPDVSKLGAKRLTGPADSRRVIIMGAAGRDFHNFNMVYRNDSSSHVVAFTAAQIPGIGGRVYPAELAGPSYPNGIPIRDESELESLCRQHHVGSVVFAYSDVPHETVMHAASRALSTGADFLLLGPDRTMLTSTKPVIAITAVRTGCGKSQTARYLSGLLKTRGLNVAVLRHPMPYGNLVRQRVQRLATLRDLDEAECTNEEREEYEPHIAAGSVVFAGVDYEAILHAAEGEADVVLWDGGNNDFSFVKPDLHIAMTDALRPGQALHYHPGETVLRSADIVIIAKTDAARAEDIAIVEEEIREANPKAPIVKAASPVTVDDAAAIRGRRVLVVEDGPTITHGGAPFGAGFAAAKANEAAEIVDPRPWAAPELRDVYRRFPHIGPVLPDMGYGKSEIAALRQTLERADADVILVAAPLDLKSLLHLDRPVVRARYDYADLGEPRLAPLVTAFLAKRGL